MLVLQNGLWLTADMALVLLGGQKPSRTEWLNCIRQAGFVAAADGGASMALQQQRYPDLLVGDFDSLPAEELAACQAADCRIYRLPVHKDKTDGEFLLQCLHHEGWRRLMILGALGGRLEQTMANLLTAAPLARQGLEICLPHDDGLLFLLGAEEDARQLCLQGFAGYTVSLLALGEACGLVDLQGFEYSLHAELPVYTSLGVSNVVWAENAIISLQNGCLLVCINF